MFEVYAGATRQMDTRLAEAAYMRAFMTVLIKVGGAVHTKS